MTTKRCWILGLLCTALLGLFAADYLPVADWAATAWSSLYESKPVVAVVVRESSQPLLLTTAQTAWIMSPKFRADAKAAGIQFFPVDPDTVDVTGKMPVDLAPAIELAKKKGLPRLVLIGSRKGLTEYVVPATETDARKRLGI